MPTFNASPNSSTSMEVTWGFTDWLAGNVIAPSQDVGGPPMSITQTLQDGSDPVVQSFNPGTAIGSIPFNGLTPSTTYLYALVVYLEDDCGDGPEEYNLSASGETKAASPPPPPPPAKPTAVSALSAAWSGTNFTDIVVSWTIGSNSTGFALAVSGGPSPNKNETGTYSPGQTAGVKSSVDRDGYVGGQLYNYGDG
jgi:hypothetical protein